jgi:hypothetical protein
MSQPAIRAPVAKIRIAMRVLNNIHVCNPIGRPITLSANGQRYRVTATAAPAHPARYARNSNRADNKTRNKMPSLSHYIAILLNALRVSGDFNCSHYPVSRRYDRTTHIILLFSTDNLLCL